MIGRTDIVIATHAGLAAALELSVRRIRSFWSDLVFAIPETGIRIRQYSQLELGHIDELFVYKNEHWADKWDELGTDASLTNTMIHLLAGEEGLTIVVDDPSESEMNLIIRAIQQGFSMDILNMIADREAA